MYRFPSEDATSRRGSFWILRIHTHRQIGNKPSCKHTLYLYKHSSLSALRGQGADVLQAEHVEPHRGEGPVLVHHVGHLGGQVGAGCCEHLTHVGRPCGRLLLLTGRRNKENKMATRVQVRLDINHQSIRLKNTALRPIQHVILIHLIQRIITFILTWIKVAASSSSSCKAWALIRTLCPH